MSLPLIIALTFPVWVALGSYALLLGIVLVYLWFRARAVRRVIV